MDNTHVIDDEFFSTLGNDTTSKQTQTSAEMQSVTPVTEKAEKKVTPRKVFSHKSDDELSAKPSPIPYLIKGYLRQKGLHMLYGESGCGKGFVILDMCESIARHEISSWHGKSIKHGDVIYFCGESADGLSARIKVWKDVRGIQEKGNILEVVDEAFAIELKEKNSDYYIDNVIDNIKALSDNPALVVIDTVNIYMAGDENSAGDVGKFLTACRKIINECDCSVLFIQHIGLSQEAKTRARGSSAFYAGVDTAMQLKKSGNVLTLSVTKSKESKLPSDLIFNLSEHVIDGWIDDDGEAVTSCTIELATQLMEYREQQANERTKPNMSEGEKFALKTYQETAKQYGEIVVDDANTGHEVIRVDETEWAKTFNELSTAETYDARRMAFRRAKKALAEKSNILTLHRENGYEYYCLDMSNDNIRPAYRLEIRTAINVREEKRKAVSNTDDTGNTGHDERTGELFKENSI